MFSKILIALLAIDSVLLVAAILLQAGKGGGLAATFGGASSSADSIMGTRQAGNLLTKLSWWTGGIFIGLAFVLSLTSSRGAAAPSSILDNTFTAPPAPINVPGAASPSAGTSVLPVTPAPATDAKTTKTDAKATTKTAPNPTKTP